MSEIHSVYEVTFLVYSKYSSFSYLLRVIFQVLSKGSKAGDLQGTVSNSVISISF